jgi:DNA-binding response OmpR family regulator
MTVSSRILFVDDDPDCCEMMCLLLELSHKNLQVIPAATAGEALSLLEREKFDLLILDYRLPDSTGLELCERIRRTDRRTPIMFYSGMAGTADRDRAQVAGADEYLVKPNDLEKIPETVRKYLNRARSM